MSGLRRAGPSVLASAPLAALMIAGSILIPPHAALAYTVSARTDYAAGLQPIASTSADIDWDGDQDLAVASFGSNSVSVRLNDGAGNFGAAVDYPVGLGPYDVVFTDVNGDGRPDLATANYWAATVSVLVNDGAGGFLPKVDYPCTDLPTGIATADLNGDGKWDIVVANYWIARASVLLNDGAGGLGAPTAFTTGAGPENVALRDLDGNGSPDLVTCNSDANSVSVLINNGAGAFGPKTDYPTGQLPYCVVIGDVDNDGDQDVVTANYTDSSISVFLNDGSGALGAKNDFAAGAGATWLKLVDVDLDRRLDVVVSDYDVAAAAVLHGDGTGAFTLAGNFATGVEAWGIHVADFNRDGVVDVAVANYGAGTASVLLGDLPGGFAVGDTAVAFKALDQDGNERSLSEFAGKWVLLDLMALWCPPCNQMALSSQQAYDSWVGHPTVSFEYLTAMVQGAIVGPSTQTQAQNWRCRYNLSRPILQDDGKYPNTLDSYFEGIDGTAFPTLVVIDPQGIIRQVVLGALEGQDLVNAIASLAGVAAPPLAPTPASLCGPPPDPTPVGGVKSVWAPLSSVSSIQIGYGGSTSTSPLDGAYDLDPVSRLLEFDLFDVSPGGVNAPYAQIQAQVDSLTGIESMFLAFLRLDGYDIAVAQPYTLRLTGMTWPDGLERMLVTPTNPVLFTYYITNHDISGDQTAIGTPLTPALSYFGGQLDIDSFDLSTVPGLQPEPWAWLISQVNFVHTVTLDVAGGSVAAGRLRMGAPWPNPAGSATQLRWALPVAARAEVEIIDVQGRRVRQLFDGVREAGPQVTSWDLTDDAGRRVRSGVYFARVRAGGEAAVTRIAVMK